MKIIYIDFGKKSWSEEKFAGFSAKRSVEADKFASLKRGSTLIDFSKKTGAIAFVKKEVKMTSEMRDVERNAYAEEMFKRMIEAVKSEELPFEAMSEVSLLKEFWSGAGEFPYEFTDERFAEKFPLVFAWAFALIKKGEMSLILPKI